MKKRIIYVTAICLSLVVITIVSAFEPSDYNIRLGNDSITLQYPSLMQNDRMYVSVRNLCDALGIPIYWNENKNEVHMDIYNKKVSVSDKTEYKEEGVIPDKETALIVGKAILEKYAGKPMEYETEDKIYYLEVEFLEQYNAWRLYQTFKYKNGGGWSATGQTPPNISINKNTGEVLFIGTSTFFKD
ncbi:MAG: hypothetical protein J6K43_02765 [Lachnospiraceae bacterium]|nr:hypothetical protein [Lachnospiraceae bacterium]